ncbi:MAG: ParA family protein [Oscillospiraceae bacterium]|nr:ParA family protein [Oscillospiraceae bacterium]
MREHIVIIGHYGSGKTTVSLNLVIEAARAGKSVTLVDLDIVNPYFRSGDSAKELERLGVRVIAPQMLGTTSDAPAIRAEVMSAFDSSTDLTIFDAGGDDAGAAVLGRFHENLTQSGYTMLYVINAFRPMTKTPVQSAEILREIECSCRLRANGIIGNSNLGAVTTAQDVLESLLYTREVSRLTGLPITAVNTTEELAPVLADIPEPVRIIRRLVRFPWEAAPQMPQKL